MYGNNICHFLFFRTFWKTWRTIWLGTTLHYVRLHFQTWTTNMYQLPVTTLTLRCLRKGSRARTVEEEQNLEPVSQERSRGVLLVMWLSVSSVFPPIFRGHELTLCELWSNWKYVVWHVHNARISVKNVIIFCNICVNNDHEWWWSDCVYYSWMKDG